jgi:hypothetical protein
MGTLLDMNPKEEVYIIKLVDRRPVKRRPLEIGSKVVLNTIIAKEGWSGLLDLVVIDIRE